MPTCSLREHSARLTQDGGGWLLRYPIARHQYGSREVEVVEVMIPLVAENYAGRAQACDVDPEGPSATDPSDPVGARGCRVAAARYSNWRTASLRRNAVARFNLESGDEFENA